MHILKSNQIERQAEPALVGNHRLVYSHSSDFRNALNIVAAAQGVQPEQILSSSRSRADIALCRQIAMYVVHVALGYTMTQTGRFFNRDRTTVSHACARIEDMRDDQGFDEVLTCLEQVLAFGRVTKRAAGRRHLQ